MSKQTAKRTSRKQVSHNALNADQLSPMNAGPPLAPLQRRLADTPAEWLQPPSTRSGEGVSIAALLSDYLESLDLEPLAKAEVEAYDGAKAAQLNWLRLTLLAIWLLHDEQLHGQLAGTASAAMRRSLLKFLGSALQQRAEHLSANSAVRSGDGREELARQLLAALGLQPAGETAAQATARLQATDSIERARLVKAAKTAQERTRKLREAMARKAAQEAAMKYNRE